MLCFFPRTVGCEGCGLTLIPWASQARGSLHPPPRCPGHHPRAALIGDPPSLQGLLPGRQTGTANRWHSGDGKAKQTEPNHLTSVRCHMNGKVRGPWTRKKRDVNNKLLERQNTKKEWQKKQWTRGNKTLGLLVFDLSSDNPLSKYMYRRWTEHNPLWVLPKKISQTT